MQWIMLIIAWMFMEKGLRTLPTSKSDGLAQAVVIAGNAVACGLCCLAAAVANRPMSLPRWGSSEPKPAASEPKLEASVEPQRTEGA